MVFACTTSKDFDVNGINYGQREAIVKATARLRPVPGGNR